MRLSLLATATALAFASPAAFAQQAQLNLSGLQTAPTHDRFIVKYREGSAAQASATALTSSLNAAARALPMVGGRPLSLQPVRELALGANVIRTGRPLDRAEAESLMRQFAADPNVEFVEVDALHRYAAEPNDPYYDSDDGQWHYHEPTGGLNLPQAWDKSTGEGIVVAVIDSGHLSHSDLDGNVIGGYDFVSYTGGGNGGSDDGNGRDSNYADASNVQHGTHVAGTIAAVTNNNLGVAGVAYGAKVVQARVLGNNGYGSTSDIADAIVWAAGGDVPGVPDNPNPAEVINLSLGGSGSCPNTYQNAVNQAVQLGSTVVIAAGNSNANVANFTPANCNNVIAVAANDIHGDRAWYSNYGSLIDVAAPGGETCEPNYDHTACGSVFHPEEGVLSTVANNDYAYYQGTSMATPHVAGAVALVQAAAATPLTPAEVEQLLEDTTRPLPGNCSGGCGAGIVDAQAAVDAVAGDGGEPGVPTAGFEYRKDGLSVNFTDTSSDSDGSIASYSWDFGDGTGSTEANPSKTYGSAGSYTVTLTVTDNDGNSDDESRTVSVSVPGDNTLENGVPVTGLAGAKDAMLRYTMEVPAGATSLQFVTSGGSGDPDLFVSFGSEPTTSNYDCRSATPGTNESCIINNVQAGTYHVLVHAYSAINGTSLTGSYDTDDGGGDDGQTYSNDANFRIFDWFWVQSSIAVSGRSGNAPADAAVAVDIKHTYRGDLQIDLVAPDGSFYRLKDTDYYDSADNVNQTYNVNLSGEALNGAWKLRVTDVEFNDTGYIDNWSITF